MVTDASRAAVDLGPTVERAGEVAALHDNDGYGYCQGCAITYGFTVPHPCRSREWADLVAQAAAPEAVTA